jgi:hypothetical protein
MRYIAAAAAFVATGLVVFMGVVFAFISFLGPHSPPASKTVEFLVYALSGLALLVLPVLAARAAWRRTDERHIAWRRSSRHSPASRS